jgi:hypothetical protein
MKYAREAWKQERISWRAVIQLNILRSVNTILNALHDEMNGLPLADDDDSGEMPIDTSHLQFSDKHQLLKLRLGPLRRVETDLKRRLGAGAEEDQAPFSPVTMNTAFTESEAGKLPKRRPQEFFVRSWRNALEKSDGIPKPTSPRHNGDERDESTEVIARCRDDMKALWEDRVVKEVMSKRRLRLEDSAEL